MTTKTAKVSYGARAEGESDRRTQWFGTTIFRRHSFHSVVRQIANHQRLNDVTKIGIQGVEGSGKTTLAHLIAHLLHIEMTKIAVEKTLPQGAKAILAAPYSVHFMGDSELVDFETTLARLPRNNRIVWFDDVSFLRGGSVSRKEIEHMKKAMTTIRHLEGGQDVRTVVGFNFHYSKSMDVYIRDVHFKLWSSLLPEELANARKILPSPRHRAVASRFQQFYAAGAQGKDVKITDTHGAGRKTTVVYKYNNPFRLAMFSDNQNLRLCVYPSMDKLVGSCGICKPSEYLADPKLVFTFLAELCGKSDFLAGLKAYAIRQWGLPVARPGTRKMITMLDRLEKNGAINQQWIVSALRAFPHTKRMRSHDWPNNWPIPAEVRDAFRDRVGVDGLRAANATAKGADERYDKG